MTGETLIDRVLTVLLESDPDAPLFYDRAEVLRALKRGLIELQLAAGIRQSTSSPTLSTASAYQTAPAGLIGILSIDKASRSLMPTQLEALDRDSPEWSDVPSAMTPTQWASIGSNMYALFPRASAAAAVTVRGIAYLTMTDDTTEIDLPEEYVESLIRYASHECRFKEGAAELALTHNDFAAFAEKAGIGAMVAQLKRLELWTVTPGQATGPEYEKLTQS